MLNKRFIICGTPRAGKTTLALKLAEEHGIVYRSTDDLINKASWEDMPEKIIEWMAEPGDWIIEGVQTARALRRLKRAELIPNVSHVYYLKHSKVELTKKQAAMGKGFAGIMADVLPWLTENGIPVTLL